MFSTFKYHVCVKKPVFEEDVILDVYVLVNKHGCKIVTFISDIFRIRRLWINETFIGNS